MIEYIEKHLDKEMRSLRRRLHARPEISGEEHETANMIAGILKKLDPDQLLTGIGGTGLAAVFHGDEPGPTVLFRAELDALPIDEENDFEYRSQRRHVSHKCGHDGHMTVLLGLAHLLADHRPEKGRVVLLFQPAEETGEGAIAVLQDLRFPEIRPDYVFAFHNLPGYPLGSVVTKEGAFTAAVRSLIVRLKGKTSHAAEPEYGINPAPAIQRVLEVAERMTVANTADPEFALFTPIYITLGEKAYGVSAGYGEVHLTLRCWTPERMQQVSADLLRMIRELTATYQLELETEWTNVFYANYNDAEAVEWIRRAAEANGFAHSARLQPLKWGEDFGAFTQRFKGAMFGLGAGEHTPALHNPDYDFPDELIEVGMQMFDTLVHKLLGAAKN